MGNWMLSASSWREINGADCSVQHRVERVSEDEPEDDPQGS